LQVPHSTATAGTASRLEAIAAATRIEVAFVEVAPAGDSFLLMPLSLAIRPTADAALGLTLLDPRLASIEDAGTDSTGARAAKGACLQAERAASIGVLPVSSISFLTSEIQDALLARCELGLAASPAHAAKPLAQHAARACNMGLGILADVCHAVATAERAGAVRAALRLAHLNDRLASMHRRLPLL
jgi:hypothetical protein